MTDALGPLSSHVRSIMRALDSCRLTINVGVEHCVPHKRDLARLFLYGDLHEAVTLLGLIENISCDLREIASQQQEHLGRLALDQHGQMQFGPESELAALMLRRMRLISELSVLTKAFYEWLYHIQEDIESESTIDKAVPESLRLQLERYCTFRNKLVTHKSKRKAYASSGIRAANDFSSFEILLVPVGGIPQAAVKKLATLYEKAKPYLDSSDALEENIFERMAILYRRLHKFPGPIQAEIKTYIDHYGTISDTPGELAAFLEHLVAALTSSEGFGTNQP